MLCSGADFYSSPELSGRDRLAWTEWNHPDMPWDSTMIKIGTLADGRLSEVSEVAGGPGESAVAPRWLGEELIFVSDRTDWWNLYLWSDGSIRALHRTDAEFCLPQWQLGQTPYAVLDHDQLLCTLNRGGEQSLAVLRVSSGELTPVPGPQVAVYSLAGGSGVAAAVLGHPDRPTTLSLLDLARQTWTEVRSSSRLTIDPESDLQGSSRELGRPAGRGARLVLPAGQRRVHRAGRHAADVDHAVARRSDGVRDRRFQDRRTSSGRPAASPSWT